MVLLQSEVQKTVADQTVTKVNGPPTGNDLNLLKEELIAIATSIPSVLGGGMNGHAGMLLSNINYATMAPGSLFVVPVNARVYPVGVTAATWSRTLAPFLEEILIRLGCFKPSPIRLSEVPSTPKDVQQVYQLNWGKF